MIVKLRIDGKETEVEVDLDRMTVKTGTVTAPFKLLPKGNGPAQVEIAGDIFSVDGWPEGLPTPPGAVAVDGESVDVDVLSRDPERGTAHPGPGRSASRADDPGIARAAPTVGPQGSTGIIPPMPGKVVEVRVADGQTVRQGDVLVVLEAMKMRNEVVSPVDGEVVGLAVRPGDNAPAHRPMLFVRASPKG